MKSKARDLLNEYANNKISVRELNILRSPKKDGSSDMDAKPYLRELGIELIEKRQRINFTSNINEHIHRWAPYVQGFSAEFVQSILDLYPEYNHPFVLDPFAGCGTVLVQAKLNGYKSIGTELNPLLQFIANTKLNCWNISPTYLLKTYNEMPRHKRSPAPAFLKSEAHFDPEVLRNLEIVKGGIESIDLRNVRRRQVKDLLNLAFSSILIECSRLKRSPCLGYCKNKQVDANAPFVLINQKIHNIAEDLKIIHSQYRDRINTISEVIRANATTYEHTNEFDLVITSPPYMNGLDYVINYKIEMGWLGFVDSHKALKHIKDEMVVCDNVSKGLIKKFHDSYDYTNCWIDNIKTSIQANIEKRGSYRRTDMPFIVHKYFDDMYKIMKKVASSLKHNSRFILVVGDSLIADVYVPTDLLIARIGMDLGMRVEKLEKARDRRSGQIRSYRLRESIVTLKKE